MTKEEIIEMARKAGGIDLTNTTADVVIWIGTGTSDFLDAFANLVADKAIAKEREACAKVVEESSLPDTYSQECLPDIANEIRARGEA
jgi:hypothetical protein